MGTDNQEVLTELSEEWYKEYVETRMGYMGDASFEEKYETLVGFVDIANMG